MSFTTTHQKAYCGLVETLKLKAGETLITFGGGYWQYYGVAGQERHAKKAAAIVGSDEKPEWIKGLGADVAVNYKHTNWKQELTDATREKAEAFSDNVGIEILDFFLTRIKRSGRIGYGCPLSAREYVKCMERYFQEKSF